MAPPCRVGGIPKVTQILARLSCSCLIRILNDGKGAHCPLNSTDIGRFLIVAPVLLRTFFSPEVAFPADPVNLAQVFKPHARCLEELRSNWPVRSGRGADDGKVPIQHRDSLSHSLDEMYPTRIYNCFLKIAEANSLVFARERPNSIEVCTIRASPTQV